MVYEREIAHLMPPLRAGGHLSVAREAGAASGTVRTKGHLTALPGGAAVKLPRYIAESFASNYVAVVWFADSGPLESTRRAALVAALPKLASLVAALPPPDPPTTTARAARVRVR